MHFCVELGEMYIYVIAVYYVTDQDEKCYIFIFCSASVVQWVLRRMIL